MTEALNLALEAINACVPPTAEDSQKLVAAKCRGLMCGYHARWQHQPYRVLQVEQVITSDLYNPETKRTSRTFTIAGKIDAKVSLNDRTYIVDHKTTSEDIDDPNSPYWRQLTVEGQPSHYMLLEWVNGRKVDGCIWDVIRKPTIRPKKIEKKDLVSITFNKTYFGMALSDEAIVEVQRTGAESLELYQARLAFDCTNERPGRYFARRPVPRLDMEIHEYATELWEHGQEVLHARNADRHARNSGACILYNAPCKFLGICSGHDEPDSDKWTPKASVHNELPVLFENGGRGVLTNSRIRTFQTCRRKHYYEYELGIERIDEDEREALFFGNVIHAALEAWFGWFKDRAERQDNEHANGSSVIGIDTVIDSSTQALTR